MKKTLTIMTVALMCTSSAAFAEHHMDDHKGKKHMDMKLDHKIEMMDSDKDGMVSKAEMASFSDNMFEKADTDKNGKLSKAEMLNMYEHEMDKMKTDMKVNHKDDLKVDYKKSDKMMDQEEMTNQ